MGIDRDRQKPQLGGLCWSGAEPTQVLSGHYILPYPVSFVRLPIPCVMCSALLHLLWQLPTQMRRHGRDSCSAAMEWMAAREDGGMKHGCEW